MLSPLTLFIIRFLTAVEHYFYT